MLGVVDRKRVELAKSCAGRRNRQKDPTRSHLQRLRFPPVFVDDDPVVLATDVPFLSVASAARRLTVCVVAPVVAAYSHILYPDTTSTGLLPVTVVRRDPASAPSDSHRIWSAAVTMSANMPQFTRALSILECSARSGGRTHELVPLFCVASADPTDVTSSVPEWAIA